MKNQTNQLKKRVNNVPIQIELDFKKALAGRQLKANEFTFQLLDDDEFNVLETATNDKDGKVKFTSLKYTNNDIGVYRYKVVEVAGTDSTVTYDNMKAVVTVTVSHDGTAKALVAKVGDIADKEFNNTVTPPERT